MTDSRDDVQYAKATTTRARILQQLSDVEKELGRTKRSSSKRPALIERKELLLRSLREESIRLKECKNVRKESPDHPITDHALVRWLERKAKIDIQSLKDRILTAELQSALSSGERAHWSDGEMVFVLANSRVITVIRKDEMWQEVAWATE